MLSAVVLLAQPACGPRATGRGTVATVEVVRSPVLLSGLLTEHAIGVEERTSAGQAVRVEQRAQALLKHDLGSRLLLDGGSEFEVTDSGIKLQLGRAFVEARSGSEVQLAVAGFTLVASGSGAGFEVQTGRDRSQLTVLRGEVAWQGPKRGVVRAGEQLTLQGEAPVASPVVLWDDWTGGLAWPDPRKGRGAAGLGEVGARRPGDLGEARFPLTIQRLQVRTEIQDDLAVTTVEETFFNPADSTLEGIFRVRLPEGAILSRFAIDRHGRFIDGYVKERETAQRQYQAQVYEGSTKDPALLEWEAPGSFKARLYPLPAGSTRRVLYTYSEWLQPHGDGGTLRTYRYPMAGAAGEGAPIIQELDIEVSAGDAGATEVRAGLGAMLAKDGRRVLMQRTDYSPSADLVVELLGPPRPEGVARLYRVPHQDPPRPGVKRGRSESDYVLIRTLPVPATAASQRAPVDLILLVDVSAATDATHLAMARTIIESVLRRLHPEDRVVLLGADLDAHELEARGAAAKAAGKGKALPALTAATPEAVQALLARLGQSATGGATDLGAALSQAAALLDPARLGAVLYVGDARPTVGELDLPGLRERLTRLPAPLRLYGVGIGDEANLDLLSGLCQMNAGRAFRVGDRAAAAETALSIMTHLASPAVSHLKVDVGTGLDRVYPRTQVSVRAGEPLFILARLRQSLPQSVTVEGMFNGRPIKQSLRLEPHKLDDSADLRLRWSEARLLQLLESGASTEEVAELGVRQNLVTPFTSFYVPSEDEVTQMLRELPEVRAAGCAKMEAAPPQGAASVATAAAPAEPAGGEGEPPKPVVVEGKMGRKAASKDRMAARDESEKKEAEEAPAADAPGAPPPPPSPSTPAAAAEAAPMREERAKAAPVKKMKADKGGGYDGLLGGDSDGNAFAGLATTGSGRGGGGTGEGTIGLGNLGTIGRGSGHGYGISAKPASKTARPRPKRGDDDDRGSEDLKRAAGQKNRRSYRAPDVDSEAYGSAVALNDGDVTVLVGILRHRPRGCSAASGQPLDERRELWRERLGQRAGVRRALEVYQDAERGCELPRWTDRREMLRLMLRNVGGPRGMVDLYGHFNDDPEEQEFLRQAILGEVRSARDLKVIYDGLGLGDDERALLAQEVVAKAKTPAERLRRIEELLIRWPGDMRLRLLRMTTEEDLGQAEAARRTAEEIRHDPYADAGARTAVGELYVRLGDEPAARRGFSEIVEFAPSDPLARRRLGDLYRAHGWFDEAYRQYQTLQALQPTSPEVLLLMAMAAAGAGHVEEALGLERRVVGDSEPGSETGVSKIALLYTELRLAELREEARGRADSEALARLLLRARETGAAGLARPVRAFLTWAHPEADLELRVAPAGETLGPANDLAPQLGLLGWHSGKSARTDVSYELEVRRVDRARGIRYPAVLTVIVDEGERGERVLRRELALTQDNDTARFVLRAGQLSPQ
ncbi:MAG: VIT domain-containing protein [Polyangia bacterium]